MGSVVPAVSGPNQHGEVVSPAGIGQPFLLVFFPYAFTGVCTGELAALRDASGDFAEAGTRVIGCSTDSMFAQRVFADTERYDFELISDHWPHGAIARAFGVFDDDRGCARRGSFAVDDTGIVRWRVVNDFGDARPVEDALAAVRRMSTRSTIVSAPRAHSSAG